MLVQLEAGNRRVTGLSLDTDETFDTPFTRRDNPHRAYITIIEGCDKSCAYCVVPFTRGPERSRTSESVMAEARAAGGTGLHRNPVAGAEREQLSRSLARGLGFRDAAGARGRVPGIRRVRYTTSHPRDFVKRHRRRHGFEPGASATTYICRCNRDRRSVLAAMDRLYTRDEYMRRIDVDEGGASAAYRHHDRYHRRFPGRDRSGFRSRRCTCWTKSSTIRSSASNTRRGPTRRRWRWKTDAGRREAAAAGDPAGEAARHSDPAQRGAVGIVRRVLVEGPT